MEQSRGHLCFSITSEYFLRDCQLYRAPVSDVVMPDGFRSGRWEAPEHMIDERLRMLGLPPRD